MKNKIVTWIIAIVMIVLVGNTVRLKYQIDKLNKNTVTLKQDADLRIGRAETLTADAQNKVKLLDQQIQDDVKKHQAIVDMYAVLDAKYNAKGSGSIVIPGPQETIYVYKDGKTTPEELKTLPYTFDDFRLHVNGDAVTHDFKYTLNQNFEVQMAETRDKHGLSQHYAELYELDSGGKRLNKLQLTKFQVIKSSDIEKTKFRWWDPKVDIGLDITALKDFSHHFGGELGVSLMSYGKSTGLTWRFLRPYIGINSSDYILGLTPALYNIADPLPVVNNIWIGPSVGRTFGNQYFLGFGVSATL